MKARWTCRVGKARVGLAPQGDFCGRKALSPLGPPTGDSAPAEAAPENCHSPLKPSEQQLLAELRTPSSLVSKSVCEPAEIVRLRRDWLACNCKAESSSRTMQLSTASLSLRTGDMIVESPATLTSGTSSGLTQTLVLHMLDSNTACGELPVASHPLRCCLEDASVEALGSRDPAEASLLRCRGLWGKAGMGGPHIAAFPANWPEAGGDTVCALLSRSPGLPFEFPVRPSPKETTWPRPSSRSRCCV